MIKEFYGGIPKGYLYDLTQEDGHDCFEFMEEESGKYVKEDMVLIVKEKCLKCGRIYYSFYKRYQMISEEQKKDYSLPFEKLD